MLTVSCKTTYRQDVASFESTLQYFRYSLHSEMESMSLKELQAFDFSEHQHIQQKIERFLIENQEQITSYQISILEKYQDTKLPNHQWQEFNLDADIFQSVLFNNKLKPILKLISIHPLEFSKWLSMAYLSHNLNAEQIASYHLKNALGQALIKTEQTGLNQWTIQVDQYTYRFVFEFDLLSKNLNIKKVLKHL